MDRTAISLIGFPPSTGYDSWTPESGESSPHRAEETADADATLCGVHNFLLHLPARLHVVPRSHR